MSRNYTTGDLPDLIKYVPGVFSSTSGLGESDIRVRGFEADAVQILINGIPVNDPESQHVYWSNWTGLSSDVQSIQVQRGVGSSLYGSGAFGGSINIETMGVSPKKGEVLRSSIGFYHTIGAKYGAWKGRDADGKGGFEGYTPMNYAMSYRYNSGLLYGGKLNFSATIERKAGDSYITGTAYDGYSFGLEAQSILGSHVLYFSFIGAPQHHNQAGTVQDMDLLNTLGREYNRRNNPYQENYYFKPQLSLRDEWTIAANKALVTNVFYTTGTGGGKYLRNDNFDVYTGKVGFKNVSQYTDDKYFGRNARFIYETTGVVLTGYNPDSTTYKGKKVSRAANLVPSDYAHSWKNDSHNDHKQFGLNTYYQQKLNEMLTLYVGGEGRFWRARHFAYAWDFRQMGPDGNVETIHQVQNRYDYYTDVLNTSVFARALIKPIEALTIQLDGQYARYSSKVDENPVQIFDFGAGKFTNKSFRTTMDMKNPDGTPVYSKDDYTRVYKFFTPRFGANYNVNRNINVMVNYSIAKKEPKSYQWFNRDRGPGANQPAGVTLKPEKINNVEFGVGYRTAAIAVKANYYHTNFTDRIESVQDFQGQYITINAGRALYQGLELSLRGKLSGFDFGGSATIASNKWKKMSVKKIFGVNADDVVNKVVPYAPEHMANGYVGYNFGNLRLGFGLNWWDNYYASYTNKYTKVDGTVADAKLPYFFDLSANISYPIQVGSTTIDVRLNFDNITNRTDNYERAAYSKDYNRNDSLRGKYNVYVVQSPLFNTFLTTEIHF
ncbi:MAG TPA: TonB-dependent receptor [Bacteroidetes bacterium]|nr:TonB-dependent receptor [Bacteroidota bacterium]